MRALASTLLCRCGFGIVQFSPLAAVVRVLLPLLPVDASRVHLFC